MDGGLVCCEDAGSATTRHAAPACAASVPRSGARMPEPGRVLAIRENKRGPSANCRPARVTRHQRAPLTMPASREQPARDQTLIENEPLIQTFASNPWHETEREADDNARQAVAYPTRGSVTLSHSCSPSWPAPCWCEAGWRFPPPGTGLGGNAPVGRSELTAGAIRTPQSRGADPREIARQRRPALGPRSRRLEAF